MTDAQGQDDPDRAEFERLCWLLERGFDVKDELGTLYDRRHDEAEAFDAISAASGEPKLPTPWAALGGQPLTLDELRDPPKREKRRRAAPEGHLDGTGEIYDSDGTRLIYVESPDGRRRVMDWNLWASTPGDWKPVPYPRSP